jgi:Regulator of G protein signaling domain
MPILGKKVAHQIVADKDNKTILQRLGLKKTNNSSSAQDNPTSAGLGKGITSNNNKGTAQPGQPTELAAPSFMDSVNPAYNPSIQAYKKKKKLHEQQKSSFLSEGALLEELLDPGHPLNKRFVKFVEDRYAQNEVALLGMCIRYKNAADNKERTKIGKQLMKEFIEIGAPRAVDIPAEQKDIVTSVAKRSQFVPGTFDEIRRTLMFDLKGNFLGRFEKALEKDAQKEDATT